MPLSAKYFVGAALHQRPVSMADGSVDTIHFRELAWTQWFDYQTDLASNDSAVRKAAVARLISEAVRDPDGSQSFDADQVWLLRAEVVDAFLEVIDRLHKERAVVAKKPSPPKESSGSGTS